MADWITLTIDGLRLTASVNSTILETALENGIYIPNLCYHPDLKPIGVCRLCMVEVKGRGITTACNTQVEEGLEILTENPEINQIRTTAVKLLLANHPSDCLNCNKDNQCELQKIAAFVGIDHDSMKNMVRTTRILPIDHSNPFFDFDPNKCVLCGICVRTCDEIQGVFAIDYANRGYDTVISTFGNNPFIESECESCGECVIRCPVGALAIKHSQKPAREVKTTCPYCGVGCNYYLGVRGNKVVSARGDRESVVNKENLCVKGRFGYEFINHSERLKIPLIKKNGEFVESTWDEALDLIVEKFSQNQKEKFAVFSSAKCTNEENYLIQKLTRAVMGTNNIDHCARLCHSPSVAGLAQSFGSGAMTNSIDEIIHASTIFAIGTNTTSAHPVIGLRVKKAVRNGAKLIVANPKEIDLCRFADIFLQHRPGSDVALMMGMMRIIVENKLHDTAFIENRCENFEAFKASLDNFDLNFVERTTGVPGKKITEAALVYASNKPSSILYSMGITQHSHGTDNVLATSNLALLTGNVGKPSTGVNPLRGQNNVQGACDMGALPNVYPGYQKVNDPHVKKKFEDAWNCALSDAPGLTHTEIIDAISNGEIKVLYQVGENPVISEANSKHVEEAFHTLDFFVVQDIFLTESAQFADVVLPAASYAEKDGTFTNTERRVQRVRQAIPPVGDSRTDWRIVCEIAKRMGRSDFHYDDPSQIMDEIASLTPIYAGISFERIERDGIQWPCLDQTHEGTKYLHSKRFTTNNGKGKFLPLTYKPSAEVPDNAYPLLLTTDRSLVHYHTSSMTGRVEGLKILNSHELLRINPKDASELNLVEEEEVNVISRRGEVKVKVNITDICPQGVVSLTFHFPETRTNILTSPALDPVAKIPETKVCAVKVEKIKS